MPESVIPTQLKLLLVRFYRMFRDRTIRPTQTIINNTRMELATRWLARREAPQLQSARVRYESAYREMDNPLVTVTIATYNRADLLIERAVSSALSQTYQNIEVIVVGDHCTDDTEARMAAIDDPRLKFYNMPQRGEYPDDPEKRWMVAGVPALDQAFSMARGLWIAHLDDDDIWEPDHLEKMLRFAYENDLELAYSRMNRQRSPDSWNPLGKAPNKKFWGRHNFGTIPHSTVVFRQYLRLFQFDDESWRVMAPTDLHVWMRMYHSGVRIGYLPQITVKAPLRPGATSDYYAAEDRH